MISKLIVDRFNIGLPSTNMVARMSQRLLEREPPTLKPKMQKQEAKKDKACSKHVQNDVHHHNSQFASSFLQVQYNIITGRISLVTNLAGYATPKAHHHPDAHHKFEVSI